MRHRVESRHIFGILWDLTLMSPRAGSFLRAQQTLPRISPCPVSHLQKWMHILLVRLVVCSVTLARFLAVGLQRAIG